MEFNFTANVEGRSSAYPDIVLMDLVFYGYSNVSSVAANRALENMDKFVNLLKELSLNESYNKDLKLETSSVSIFKEYEEVSKIKDNEVKKTRQFKRYRASQNLSFIIDIKNKEFDFFLSAISMVVKEQSNIDFQVLYDFKLSDNLGKSEKINAIKSAIQESKDIVDCVFSEQQYNIRNINLNDKENNMIGYARKAANVDSDEELNISLLKINLDNLRKIETCVNVKVEFILMD